MPASTLTTVPLGPFDGIIDTKGTSVPTPNKLRNAQNWIFQGQAKMSVRSGSVLSLTLQDDATGVITRVLAVQQFMDSAIAVAHSTVTSKVYLYRFPATMDGWYDATGALQATAFPEPIGTLWSSIPTAPDVSVDEGLGTLYVANGEAADENGVYYATQMVTFTTAGVPTIANLPASGTGGSSGADAAYFSAIASFHQHLWGVGYGIGNTAGYSSYRPELGRFSQPGFGPLQISDSIVIGDRVRALRERGVILRVAGNALFVGAAKALFRITGYGRDSWIVETLDERYGVVGPKAGVVVGNTLYYWSARGLMRCSDTGSPQPLWDAIVGVVATVANEAMIVLGFDATTDQVLVTYDAGSGVRSLCAFDTRRDDYASTNGDIGLVVACAGVVEPIYKSTAIPPSPPTAPAIVSTTSVTGTAATGTMTPSDVLSQTEVSLRVQGSPAYTILPLVDAGGTTVSFTGLAEGTAYEWRIRAYRYGVYSAYVGPTTDSQFVTTGTSGAPLAPSGLSANPLVPVGSTVAVLNWTNADAALPTQILRSSDGSIFAQIGTAVAGATTSNDDTGSYGTFYYEVRHVTAAYVFGAVSNVATCILTPDF